MERHYSSEHCLLKIALFQYTSVGRCGMDRNPPTRGAGFQTQPCDTLFVKCQAMDNVGGARAERDSLKSTMRYLGFICWSRVPDGWLTQPLLDGRGWARWETVSGRQQLWLPQSEALNSELWPP